MPIYEYTCRDCENQFEKFVRSMTSNVEVKCPDCGGTHVKKGWSVFGTGQAVGSFGGLGTSAASNCGPTGGT
jgi:putative FmdB family regulatory protein